MRSNSQRFYLLMWIGGILGGGLLMAFGILLGGIVGRPFMGGWGDLVLAILGGIVGSILGGGLGVYLTRRWLGLRASLWRSWAGSGLAGIVFMALAAPLVSTGSAGVGIWWALLIGVPPIFAILLGGRVANQAE